MPTVFRFILGMVFVSVFAVSQSAVAQAGKRAKCVRYAQTAVDQQRQNSRNRCGLAGFEWHLNEPAHFGWCLTVGKRARKNGTKFRRRALNRCVGNQGNNAGQNNLPNNNPPNNNGAPAGQQNQQNNRREAACANYATTAVSQYRRAKQLRCGFSSRRWQANYNRHKNWCKKVTQAQSRGETRVRARQIAQCRSRGANAGNGAAQAIPRPKRRLLKKPFHRGGRHGFKYCRTYDRADDDPAFPTRCRVTTVRASRFVVARQPNLVVYKAKPGQHVLHRSGKYTITFRKPARPARNRDCNGRNIGVPNACDTTCQKLTIYTLFESGQLASVTRPTGRHANACLKTYTARYIPAESTSLLAYDTCAFAAYRAKRKNWHHDVTIKIPIKIVGSFAFPDAHTEGRGANWRYRLRYQYVLTDTRSFMAAKVRCR